MGVRDTRVRSALLLAIACSVLVVPGRAEAHAGLISSVPSPGARISTAPGFVDLRFGEAINQDLSKVVVVDPTGRQFVATAKTDQQMIVQLRSNAPGLYEVRWTTVSRLDGHTLRGAFRFGVGVAPGAGGVSAPGPRGADLPLGVARAVEFAGLLTSVGMLAMRRLAGRDLDWVDPRVRVSLTLAFAGGLATTLGDAFDAAGWRSMTAVATYLTTGLPGYARLFRVAAEAVALGASKRSPRFTTAALAATLPAVAASGHAAAVGPQWWGIGVDTAHLVSAGLWAGSIVSLATLRPPGGWRGGQGAELLRRFTPLALPAFLITVGTGSLRASEELSKPSDLLRSGYGRVLSLKLTAIAAMIPLSVLAWRRLRSSLRIEAVLATLAAIAAAVLALYPLPPGRAEAAEEAIKAATSSDFALPTGGELTLGGYAGNVLVGLSLRPGLPGLNDVLLFVQSSTGAPLPQNIPVQLRQGARTVAINICGPACRSAQLPLHGGEQLKVHIKGQGNTDFRIPELPTRDGSALLERAYHRMHRLHSLRISETLRPAKPPARTEYTFMSPDRMRLESSRGYKLIVIGMDQYQGSRGSSRWQVTHAQTFSVPFFTWEGFSPIAVRIVGAERIDGVDTHVISYFSTDRTPIWFRLWIDDQGIVHRMEMRALGHFMDHRLFGFDAPVRIEPPVKVE